MDKDINALIEHLASATDWLRDEIKGLRGNRPSVETVEDVKLNYYGESLPVKQLASLSVVPPRSIVIQVWDKNAVGPVTKAIEDAQIGFSTSAEGTTIYANLSPLTDERREELSRVVKKYAETARIQIRNHRDETIKSVKAKEESGEYTEDDMFSLKEKIQKEVDCANARVEELVEKKIKEIAA
mgnify:CR=1 FL=1